MIALFHVIIEQPTAKRGTESLGTARTAASGIPVTGTTPEFQEYPCYSQSAGANSAISRAGWTISQATYGSSNATQPSHLLPSLPQDEMSRNDVEQTEGPPDYNQSTRLLEEKHSGIRWFVFCWGLPGEPRGIAFRPNLDHLGKGGVEYKSMSIRIRAVGITLYQTGAITTNFFIKAIITQLVLRKTAYHQTLNFGDGFFTGANMAAFDNFAVKVGLTEHKGVVQKHIETSCGENWTTFAAHAQEYLKNRPARERRKAEAGGSKGTGEFSYFSRAWISPHTGWTHAWCYDTF